MPTKSAEAAVVAVLAAIAVSLVGAPVPPASAFGTVIGMGQNAEHQRITRIALACPTARGGACFQPRSMAALAGEEGRPGAIGLADLSPRLTLSPRAHCDDGDYLDRPGYPQSAASAQGRLTQCREWMRLQLDRAVADAAALTDDKDRLADRLSVTGCFRYLLPRRGPKCRVLTDLGLMMHAAQDFYAHTNWADRPDPARPLSTLNPPGLGQSGAAAWISLRANPAMPTGLISGCFKGLPERWFCNDGPGGRIKHAALDKDDGQIEPTIGAGSTPRGRIGDNFARAVRAAIEDTRDKWALYQERLAERYGVPQAARMICLLTSDQPDSPCATPTTR